MHAWITFSDICIVSRRSWYKLSDHLLFTIWTIQHPCSIIGWNSIAWRTPCDHDEKGLLLDRHSFSNWCWNESTWKGSQSIVCIIMHRLTWWSLARFSISIHSPLKTLPWKSLERNVKSSRTTTLFASAVLIKILIQSAICSHWTCILSF